MMKKILLFLVVVLSVIVGLVLWDVSHIRESYALPFNRALEQLVLDHQLIGEHENTVVQVLGEPSFRYVYEDEDYTLNYCPSKIMPLNKFQAHFGKNGSLRAIELMDD